ncbi:chloride anion exchanger-like [Rhinoderma darwinii]|uniref:chloride anion exchanger-like n=1 Tax=Rhinoderma darwinii TaxID=43563 RepID=UPI003F68092D
MSGMKALKAVLKEFNKVEVDTYITRADCSILDKLKRSEDLDKNIKTSISYITVHDAVLHVLEEKGLENNSKDPGTFCKSLQVATKGTIYINDNVVSSETQF